MRTTIRLVWALSVVLVLAGCSTTPRDIEGDAGLSALVTAPTSVETAYRRVVTGARACLQYNVVRIDADFFPDVREGTVTIQAISPGSMQMAFGTLKFTAIDAERSHIAIRYAKNFGPRGATWVVHAAREWASGDAAYCNLDNLPL